MKNDDYTLKDLFPRFCISWEIVARLFGGGAINKIMGFSLLMIVVSLINPLGSAASVAYVVMMGGEMNEIVSALIRVAFLLSLAIIVSVSILTFDKALWIYFGIYLCAIKLVLLWEGRTDAIMALIFALCFFVTFFINKTKRKDEGVEFIDEDEFTKISEEEMDEVLKPVETPEERFRSFNKTSEVLTDNYFRETNDDDVPKTDVDVAKALEDRFKFTEAPIIEDFELPALKLKLETLRQNRFEKFKAPFTERIFSIDIKDSKALTIFALIYILNPRHMETILIFMGLAVLAFLTLMVAINVKKRFAFPIIMLVGTVKSLFFAQFLEIPVFLIVITGLIIIVGSKLNKEEKIDIEELEALILRTEKDVTERRAREERIVSGAEAVPNLWNGDRRYGEVNALRTDDGIAVEELNEGMGYAIASFHDPEARFEDVYSGEDIGTKIIDQNMGLVLPIEHNAKDRFNDLFLEDKDG